MDGQAPCLHAWLSWQALRLKMLSRVRQNYDIRAVEEPEQEQWVLWFAGEVKRRGHSAGGKY